MTHPTIELYASSELTEENTGDNDAITTHRPAVTGD
jgi:hypothetical protein